MNGRTFSQNLRKRGKSHNHSLVVSRDESSNIGTKVCFHIKLNQFLSTARTLRSLRVELGVRLTGRILE